MSSPNITLNVVLEEAINSWNEQIRELGKTGEWFDDNSPLGRKIAASIKKKKELIDCAKMYAEVKSYAMAGKG